MHAAPVGLETRRDLGIMAPRQPPRRPWVAGKGVGWYTMCHGRTSHRPARKKPCRARWRQRSPKGSKGAEPVEAQERRKFLVGPSLCFPKHVSWKMSVCTGSGSPRLPWSVLLFANDIRDAATACRTGHGMMHLACLKHTSLMPG
jgi:hypothetical protein